MKANHFSEHKPCVILLVQDADNPQVLQTEDGKPMVFERYTKARKYAANNLEPEYHPFIEFANETPVMGAGDREDTNNRRCLKCKGFLRLGSNSTQSQLPSGDVVAMDEYVCPACDLGEK
jgi:hypothetical protein